MYGVINYKDFPKLTGEIVTILEGYPSMLMEEIPKGYTINAGETVIGGVRFVVLEKTDANHDPTKYLYHDSDLRRWLRNEENVKVIEKIIGKFFITKEPSIALQPNEVGIPVIYYGSGAFGAKREDDSPVTITLKTEYGDIRVNDYPSDILYPISVIVKKDEEQLVLAQGTREKIYMSAVHHLTIPYILRLYKAAPEIPLAPSNEHVKRTFEKILNKSRDDVKRNILAINSEVKNLQTQIIKSVQKKSKLEIALQQFGEVVRVTEKDIEEKIQKLESMPAIRKAMFISNKLLIETHPITCKGKDKLHLIGRMMIRINLTNFNILFENLDFTLDRKPSPHTFGDGTACFGNIAQDIPKLIGEYELVSAVMMIIGFLEQANLRDHEGAKVKYWPVIKDNKIVDLENVAILNQYCLGKKEINLDEYKTYCLDHPGLLG